MLFGRDWKRIFTANLWLLLRPGLRGVDILVIPITYLVKLSTEHLWRNRFSSYNAPFFFSPLSYHVPLVHWCFFSLTCTFSSSWCRYVPYYKAAFPSSRSATSYRRHSLRAKHRQAKVNPSFQPKRFPSTLLHNSCSLALSLEL